MSNLHYCTTQKRKRKNNDNCVYHNDKDERSDDDNEKITQCQALDDDTCSGRKEEEKCEMITNVSFANITLNKTYDNDCSNN